MRSARAGPADESRKSRGIPRQEGIKTLAGPLNRADAVPGRRDTSSGTCVGEPMSVVIYIVLTVLIFGLLGLVQKLVEGL